MRRGISPGMVKTEAAQAERPSTLTLNVFSASFSTCETLSLLMPQACNTGFLVRLYSFLQQWLTRPLKHILLCQVNDKRRETIIKWSFLLSCCHTESDINLVLEAELVSAPVESVDSEDVDVGHAIPLPDGNVRVWDGSDGLFPIFAEGSPADMTKSKRTI